MHTHTCFRLDLISGDCRSAHAGNVLDLDPETLQRLPQNRNILLHFRGIAAVFITAFLQQRQRREHIVMFLFVSLFRSLIGILARLCGGNSALYAFISVSRFFRSLAVINRMCPCTDGIVLVAFRQNAVIIVGSLIPLRQRRIRHIRIGRLLRHIHLDIFVFDNILRSGRCSVRVSRSTVAWEDPLCFGVIIKGIRFSG
ncbi:unknown [Clostridium sp. CAG:448]|nr:unknown [Clostridium sp. CAG:448]